MSKPIDQESELKRCAACRKERPVSDMKTCMHNQMHRYVCDSKCMHDFYNPPKAEVQTAGVAVPDMPPTKDRRPYDDEDPDGYLEGNNDWTENNNEAVEWLADNHAAIRLALAAAPHPVSGEQKAVSCASCQDSACDQRFSELVPCPDCAAKPAIAEFFVDHAILRKALGMYGISAPESDHELGARMESYAVKVIKAVAKLPFPAAQDVAGLAAFANEMIDIAFEGGDADGGQIQEAAEKHGLLVKHERQSRCQEEFCNCAIYGFPADCYVRSEQLRAHRAQQGEQSS